MSGANILLRKCRDQFAMYAENHRKKEREDRNPTIAAAAGKKAQVNAQFVVEIEAFLAGEHPTENTSDDLTETKDS